MLIHCLFEVATGNVGDGKDWTGGSYMSKKEFILNTKTSLGFKWSWFYVYKLFVVWVDKWVASQSINLGECGSGGLPTVLLSHEPKVQRLVSIT